MMASKLLLCWTENIEQIGRKEWKRRQWDEKVIHLDLPGDPVVKNLPSCAGDMGFIPDERTKIPHVTKLNYWAQVPQQKILHATAQTQHCQINKY